MEFTHANSTKISEKLKNIEYEYTSLRKVFYL